MKGMELYTPKFCDGHYCQIYCEHCECSDKVLEDMREEREGKHEKDV